MEAVLYFALPVLMGLFAVGVVLAIKITRRRQATRGGALDGTVPAKPLSERDARRMALRYLLAAAVIIGVTAAATTWVAMAT